jgi:ornithine cyclodeaminase/alanine dehydrogenase-like protein (mu-crystallin family)
MQLLVLSGPAVHEVLDDTRCASAMREVLIARAHGKVFQPLRSILRPSGAAGLMALMPSYQPGPAAGYGLKAICITPGNPAMGLDSHQGIVLLSSPDTGEPLAVLNASAVTEIRTAAVSAVATSILARPEADVLAIIGTGVQARAHIRAIAASRPLAQIRVAGRTQAKAAKFAAEMGSTGLTGLAGSAGGATAVIGCDSVRAALDGAGIVVTATSSAEPVLRRDWLAPGTHINAVGACLPHVREIDTATITAAALFADSRESVLAESGDYLIAAAESGLGPDHVRAEIGDLLAGLAPGAGRRDRQEITVFESLGLAVEDLAAASVAYRAASELGAGTWIDF